MAQGGDELFERYGREYRAGECLYREGDEAEQVYVVHEGHVVVTTTVRGLTKTLQEAGQGAVIGEAALIVGRRREASATATVDSKILVIDRRTFETMARTNPEIAVRLIRKLARRLDRANRDTKTLLYRDAAARRAAFLLDAAGADFPSVESIAATLGLRPGEIEELTRRFVGAGLLKDDGHGPRVADPEELRRNLQFLDLRERFGSIEADPAADGR